MKNNKWNKKNCLNDAKKYKTKTEWKNSSVSAYCSAYRNDWFEECCKHMATLRKPNGFWTLKKCKLDALNYETRSEWEKNSGSAYLIARKNNWLDVCCKHMKKNYKM